MLFKGKTPASEVTTGVFSSLLDIPTGLISVSSNRLNDQGDALSAFHPAYAGMSFGHPLEAPSKDSIPLLAQGA